MSDSLKASLVLIFTCACWAFSFPAMKALSQVGLVAEPAASTLFFAFLCIACRFSAAGALLGCACLAGRIRFTRLEMEQGLGLGTFSGLGLVLQMDGMGYTLASTSAFLTQAYCILIPIWVSLRIRTFPPPQVVGACVLALTGAAVLAGLGTDGFRFGRGEWETLAGSVLFTGQILWLERPRYRSNHSRHATVIMFLVTAAITWPMAMLSAPTPSAVLRAFASPTALALLGILIGLCTLVTFPLANHWQPRVSATQAGLLYCTEPIFTSLVTLFVPGWISSFAHIAYANETLTPNLVMGGLLILAANVWLILRPAPTPNPA